MRRNYKREDVKEVKEETKKRNPSKNYIVKKKDTLLEFLLSSMSSSRNNIKALLARKQVAVNGACVSQFDYELVKDDEVSIHKYPLTPRRVEVRRKLELDIIYEDDDLIVINKPSGLLTIATEKEKDKTCYKLLLDYVKERSPKSRVYVVHRIDKDTSGVLMFVKNEDLKNKLQDDWNKLVTKREYIAVAEGIFDKKEGTVKSWLRETNTNMMYSASKKGDGQEAITHYKVIKESEKFSLLEVNIDTGRKNQIRVHMKDLGHNIVGDDKYSGKYNPLKRLGLHAKELEIRIPTTNEVKVFKAPVPKEFYSLFDNRKIKKA